MSKTYAARHIKTYELVQTITRPSALSTMITYHSISIYPGAIPVLWTVPCKLRLLIYGIIFSSLAHLGLALFRQSSHWGINEMKRFVTRMWLIRKSIAICHDRYMRHPVKTSQWITHITHLHSIGHVIHLINYSLQTEHKYFCTIDKFTYSK